MGRKSIPGRVTKSFSLTEDSYRKLKDIAYRENINTSQALVRLIDEYSFVSFNVTKEQRDLEEQINQELEGHSNRMKELQEKRKELAKINKQKKILDRAMSSKKEEAIQKLASALNRGSSYEGIDAIAKEGQRQTGIDARDLISEAVGRKNEF